MSSLPPSTPALQRILSGDTQSIMTEVSQIDAAGSAVLDGLLYSDGAVPSSPIRIPSPVRGQSVEPLLKHAFFNPTDVGATLAFMEKAAQKAVDVREKKAEIARNRAASRASTATPTKRTYKPKRASQLAKEVIVDPRLEEIGSASIPTQRTRR